jgi:hypothetical protein
MDLLLFLILSMSILQAKFHDMCTISNCIFLHFNFTKHCKKGTLYLKKKINEKFNIFGSLIMKNALHHFLFIQSKSS